MRLDRRLLLVLTVLALPLVARAAPRKTVVLFVCPAGTVKSAIAREMLRRRVAATGLPVEVVSRAISPEDHVSPALAQRLRADGIDPAAEPARPLTPADVEGADVVVGFDAAADAALMRRARAWRTPSWNADYDNAKVDLERRLDSLVAELGGGRP